MKVVADALGVARSNLILLLKGATRPRQRYRQAQDGVMAARITTLVSERPIYGYLWITVILNRELRTEGLPPVNH
ncbi:hypothetical protein GCM10019059_44490 [Camelimonas fluminis]|nr:hypothetical protein GCM10019059_44490 [Camelimonas fluminis]